MGLRFDPIGGGQFKQFVQQLFEAENRPIQALQIKKAKEDQRLKLFQEFKTHFTELNQSLGPIATSRNFRELKADLGTGAALMDISLDKTIAEPGTYTVEIDQLATAPSMISNGFPNALENYFGEGSILIPSEDGDSIEISITAEHSSLRDLATLINQNPHASLRAAVIQDSSDPDRPWKLLLKGKKEGENNTLEHPQFYFTETNWELSFEEDHDAQNASVLIDDFSIELESNSVHDFLPGVHAQLKQAQPNAPFSLTISADHEKITEKVKKIIEKVNQVLQFIVQQNTLDAHSDTSTSFGGDTSLQSLEYRLRNLIHSSYSIPEEDHPVYLSQMGIEFEKDGQIQFHEEKFNQALAEHFDTVSQVITHPDHGFATRLKEITLSYDTRGTGILNTKEIGIKNQMQQIDQQIEQKTRIIDQRKQDITRQFTRLESTLGSMQRQQQYLTSALGGGGGNPIQQLIQGM